MQDSKSNQNGFVQRGVTLVELLVAIALMGVVTLATIALYNTSAATYRTIDANQELQNKARFVFEIVTQAARIAGYEDKTGRSGIRGAPDSFVYAGKVFAPNGAIPPIRGYHNSLIPSASTNTVDYDGATGANNGVNQSDTLAIRFFGSGMDSDGSRADGSIVDCTGSPRAYPNGTTWGDIPVSLFTVDLNGTEPELVCITLAAPDAATLRTTAAGRFRYNLVRGVETFQVVYAIDTGGVDGLKVPENWVSAEAITTATAWSQVRWIKVGIVIRGEPGSATAASGPLYPLGKDFIGSKTDAGLIFTPPNDGRLRRAFTTTIQLRNPL